MSLTFRAVGASVWRVMLMTVLRNTLFIAVDTRAFAGKHATAAHRAFRAVYRTVLAPILVALVPSPA